MKITEHFTLAEAEKSSTAIRLGLDNSVPREYFKNLQGVAVNILEPCRSYFNIPFSPSSWFRCYELNRAVGGSGKSEHLYGYAVDFEIPGIHNIELAKFIVSYKYKDEDGNDHNISFNQLILEFLNKEDATAGWIHCSYKNEKENKNEIKIAYKNKGKIIYKIITKDELLLL